MSSPSSKRSPLPPKSISDLPPELIESILSRLPIRDAVCTSVLSRTWRRRWRSIPDLSFSFAALNVAAVDHVLLHHRGPIRSFSISATLYSGHPGHHMARWLAALSAAAPDPLRSLTLDFRCFQSAAYSAISPFHNLIHLKLTSAVFQASSSSSSASSPGFPLLQTLDLEGCDFPDDAALPDLISSCPLLQKLMLVNVEDCVDLHIQAPNLQSLVFSGWAGDLVSVTAPLLTSASIDLSIPEESLDGESTGCPEQRNLFEVFGHARGVEKLELLDSSVRSLVESKPLERITDKFESLKVLKLYVDFGSRVEVSAMLCLLRATPNLHILQVDGPICYQVDDGLEPEVLKEHQHLELPNLHTLELTLLACEKPEFEFIDFMLWIARGLKKMVIYTPWKLESIYESKFKDLVDHWKDSTQAEIILTGIGQTR